MTDAALRLDAYLEGLLSDRRGRLRAAPLNDPDTGTDPSASPDPALPTEGIAAGLDPWEARVAAQLARALVRFHPSFRFEEALAARLRAAADAMLGVGPSRDGRVLAFPRLAGPETPGAFGTDADELREGIRARDLLVGGAIASGLSLAGAAVLAWRRGHRVAP